MIQFLFSTDCAVFPLSARIIGDLKCALQAIFPNTLNAEMECMDRSKGQVFAAKAMQCTRHGKDKISVFGRFRTPGHTVGSAAATRDNTGGT
jgi:hypothetical protein